MSFRPARIRGRKVQALKAHTLGCTHQLELVEIQYLQGIPMDTKGLKDSPLMLIHAEVLQVGCTRCV